MFINGLLHSINVCKNSRPPLKLDAFFHNAKNADSTLTNSNSLDMHQNKIPSSGTGTRKNSKKTYQKVAKKQPFVDDTKAILELERQIITKYGTSAYKKFISDAENIDGEDDFDEDDEEDEAYGTKMSRRNRGVSENNDKPKVDSRIGNSKVEEKIVEIPVKEPVRRSFSLIDRLKERKKSISDSEDMLKDFDVDIQSKETVENSSNIEPKPSAPDEVDSGFRFRRPPLQDPKPKIENDSTKKNAKSAETLALEKAQEKNKFTIFQFRNEEDVDNILEQKKIGIFSEKSFEEIGVSNAQLLRNLDSMGLMNPTKIQERAIPVLKAGQNSILQAQTGSGKTLAFLIPLLDIVDPNLKKVQAIVIAPSRELVTQIGLVGEKLFKNTGINVLSIIGGANVKNQIKRLRDDKPQIVIATPGRLAELVFGLQKMKLSMVNAVIVDEIDNMLDEPFLGELQTIIEATPVFNRQNVKLSTTTPSTSNDINEFNDDDDDSDYDDIPSDDDDSNDDGDDDSDFHATTPRKRMACFSSATGNDPRVKAFAEKIFSGSWNTIALEKGNMLPSTITHGLISTPRNRAFEQLKRFLNAKPEIKSALIFVNDPYRVEIICEKLLEIGMVAAPLHGESSKDDRKEVLVRLRDGRVNMVVTTELAARGIDVPEITHVINYELPTDAQHYVHRAGRCGRAGRTGLVMNFANPDTKFVIRRFGKQLGIKVQDCEIREGKIYLKTK